MSTGPAADPQSSQSPDPPGGGAIGEPGGEPCPTPLSTAEVLAAFEAESERWEVERDGVTLRGRAWGQGRPLYVLGGFTGTCDQFALMAYLLREDCRCVLCEHREGGRFDLKELSADVRAVADARGDKRLSLFASSFASLVACQILLDEPNRIERVVIEGGFAHRRLSLTERCLLSLARFLPGTVASLPGRLHVERNNHRAWFPPFDAARWQFYLDDAGRTPIKQFARRAALAHKTDLRGRLREITRPILLLRTEGEGILLNELKDDLTGRLRAARSEWLTNAGRIAHLTHPHRVAALVREFLARGEGRGARDEED